MVQCTRCDDRMNYNDETTKITEYACRTCHHVEIVRKQPTRSTA